MYQLPAFIDRHTSDYFTGSIFFCPHGVEAHNGVPFPRCCNDDRINVLVLQQFAVAIRPIINYLRFWLILFGEQFKRTVYHPLLDIANGNDFHIVTEQRLFHMPLAPQTGADESETNFCFLVFGKKCS